MASNLPPLGYPGRAPDEVGQVSRMRSNGSDSGSRQAASWWPTRGDEDVAMDLAVFSHGSTQVSTELVVFPLLAPAHERWSQRLGPC